MGKFEKIDQKIAIKMDFLEHQVPPHPKFTKYLRDPLDLPRVMFFIHKSHKLILEVFLGGYLGL